VPAALPVDVDTDLYAGAGEVFLAVNGAVCDVVADVATAAGDGGGMAGSDSGGAEWSESYDSAAASALTAGATLADSLGRVGVLLAASAANHADADVASGAPVYPGSGSGAPSAEAVLPAAPPSADGSPADPPAGWFLVAHLLQYTWPDGHQDQLRAVAAGWSAAADALTAEADRLTSAIADVSSLQSPEVADAVATCCSVQQSAWDLSAAYATLATTCSDYATHLDEAHSEVLHELTELAIETAAIQAASAAAAAVSAGWGEAAGQALQSARIALTAGKVGRVLAKLMGLVRALTGAVRAVATRVAEVLKRLQAVLAKGGTQAVEVVSHLPQLSQLRRITCPARQLEDKFKHASVFGVDLPRGRAGFDAFGKALEAFVQSPTTIRVSRPFRGQPAILNYDMNSMLMVVQTPSGEFVTGWKMSLEQLRNVLQGRPVSGG
jgi:phosphohistidine phosphatase SixA/predicted heme/steroid binding protein